MTSQSRRSRLPDGRTPDTGHLKVILYSVQCYALHWTDKNNEHRLTWGSILYGLRPQHPEWGSNCWPCCMGVAAYVCITVRAGKNGGCLEKVFFRFLGFLKVFLSFLCFSAQRRPGTKLGTKKNILYTFTPPTVTTLCLLYTSDAADE